MSVSVGPRVGRQVDGSGHCSVNIPRLRLGLVVRQGNYDLQVWVDSELAAQILEFADERLELLLMGDPGRY